MKKDALLAYDVKEQPAWGRRESLSRLSRPQFGKAFFNTQLGWRLLFACYAQKRCFPMVVMRGRDQIQALVAVSGLK